MLVDPSLAARSSDGAWPTLVCFPRVVKRPVFGTGWITADAIAHHLRSLRELGCTFTSLAAMDPAAPAALGRLPVMVGFGDEGAEFVDHAWPVLQRLGISPVLFVRSACVGRGRRAGLCLSWTELRQLVARGASVQSAGHHGLDPERVRAEMVFGDLIRARRELENRLGDPPVALQYPLDRATEPTRLLAAQAGFELGFAAGIEPPYRDPLALGRIPVGVFSRSATLRRRIRQNVSAPSGVAASTPA